MDTDPYFSTDESINCLNCKPKNRQPLADIGTVEESDGAKIPPVCPMRSSREEQDSTTTSYDTHHCLGSVLGWNLLSPESIKMRLFCM